MRTITALLLSLFFLSPFLVPAQQNKPSCEMLFPNQVSTIIDNAVKKQFGIDYAIFRVYKYTDRSGQYYCVLTEKLDSLDEKDSGGYDTLHYSIRAINLKMDSGRFKKAWEINDHADRDPKKEFIEQSIWFWTRYVEFTDFDGDGLIEPIIVYGSRTNSETEGGRIKFIIYYKGRKIAIRHQESDLDEGRYTEFDAAYNSLPTKLKAGIQSKMQAMEKGDQAVF